MENMRSSYLHIFELESMKSEQGYLLLEILISVPLIAILAGALMVMLSLAYGSSEALENKTETQYQGRVVWQMINNDMKNCKSVKIENSGNILKMLDYEKTEIVYAISKDHEVMRRYKSSNTPICENVESFEYSIVNENLLIIKMKTGKGNSTRSWHFICSTGIDQE